MPTAKMFLSMVLVSNGLTRTARWTQNGDLMDMDMGMERDTHALRVDALAPGRASVEMGKARVKKGQGYGARSSRA